MRNRCLRIGFSFLMAIIMMFSLCITASADNQDVFKKIDDLYSVNTDACGWIQLDGTNIDYALMQGRSNSTYISKDNYKNFYIPGSIFLDFMNNRDFSDYNTVIYGHNTGGIMFSEIKNYDETEGFWDANKTGKLYYGNKAYNLEVMAYVFTDAFDDNVIDPEIRTEEDKAAYLNYVKEKASRYRDVGATTSDKFLTLITCHYSDTYSRSVLIVKVTDSSGSFTVSNTVTGDSGDHTLDFNYEITFSDGGSYDCAGSKNQKVESGGSVLLKHGESITFDGIPSGVNVTVVEKPIIGYTTTLNSQAVTTLTHTIEAKESFAFNYVNNKPFVPGMGVDIDNIPFILLLAVGFVGISAFAIMHKKSLYDF